jgi:hypothetical protein
LSGQPLSFAWLIFSEEDDPEVLEAIRIGTAPKDEGRAERAKAELLRRLRSGELLAAGVVETQFMGGEVLAAVRPSICREGPVNWATDAIIEGPHSFRKVRVYFSDRAAPVAAQSPHAPSSNERTKSGGAAGEKVACTDVLVQYALSRPQWDGAMNDAVYEYLNAILKIAKKNGLSNKEFVDDRTWRNRRQDARKKLEKLGKPSPSRWVT